MKRAFIVAVMLLMAVMVTSNVSSAKKSTMYKNHNYSQNNLKDVKTVKMVIDDFNGNRYTWKSKYKFEDNTINESDVYRLLNWVSNVAMKLVKNDKLYRDRKAHTYYVYFYGDGILYESWRYDGNELALELMGASN